MKVAIAGASGYTGVELLRYLLGYKDTEIDIVQITSRQYAGKKLSDVFPHFSGSRFENLVFSEELDLDKADFYFLCLPHEPSVELVKNLQDKNKYVIDLSAAYRITEPEAYKEFYKFEHKYPELLKKAVYGLPELFREKIKKAKIIANPGCYPTASILALYPAVKEGILSEDTIVINALSGISGAGRKLNERFHYPEAFGNSYPYSPLNHRHIPEMENVIERATDKKVKIRFTPHILPVSRGMIATITFKTDTSAEKLKEIYNSYYQKEQFIRLRNNPPEIKAVNGSNYCDIYVNKDDRTGMAIIISAIDNLGKGASSQAIQNFNILAGFEEGYNLLSLSQIGIVYP